MPDPAPIELGLQTHVLADGTEVDVRTYLLTQVAVRPPAGPPAPEEMPAPVAHWKFDGDLADAAGDEDLSGAATYAAGKFGDGLASGEVTRNPLGVLAGGPLNGTYSIAMWVKLTSGMSGSAAVSIAGGDGANVGLGGNPFGPGFSANDPGFAAFVSAGVPAQPIDTLYHLAAVVGGGTVTPYLNGVAGTPQSMAGLSGTIGTVLTATASNGVLDAVRIFDVALTAGDVEALAAATSDD